MKTLEIKLYSPHPKQRAAHASLARFKALNWGRRTGKSDFAINECVKKAIKRKGRYWIVAPTYKQAKNIYWYDLALTQVPKELIRKKNESELIITLLNGSTIELKGADNEDSLRGAGIKGVVLDEYAFMKPHVWDLILRPMLADSKGWAVFVSTPNGFNHFYDVSEMAQAGENWYYSHATSYDNPYIDNEEIDSIRSTMDETQFAQEYLGEFKKMTGLVYKSFERDTHLVDPRDIPREGTNALTIDFGHTNPTAVLFVRIDYDNNWWVYDEIYEREMVTEKTSSVIKTKMGTDSFTYRIGDSAATQEIANLNIPPHTLGIVPVKKEKDSIPTGIKLIQDKLVIQEGTGKPKLFIAKTCKNLIWEFETYRYPEKKMDRNESEDPIKENDHALDALRYLALTLNYKVGVAKIHKPKGMLERKRH